MQHAVVLHIARQRTRNTDGVVGEKHSDTRHARRAIALDLGEELRKGAPLSMHQVGDEYTRRGSTCA